MGPRGNTQVALSAMQVDMGLVRVGACLHLQGTFPQKSLPSEGPSHLWEQLG